MIPGPTPGNLIETVDALVVAVNLGGGAVIGNYSTDYVTSSSFTLVPFDGAAHGVSVINASHPDWLDGSGNILLPGLYVLGVYVSINTPPTTPGLFGNIASAFNTVVNFAVDGIVALSTPAAMVDIQSLSIGDLPYPTSCNVRAQNDVTGVFNVSSYIVRVAH